MNIPQLLSTTSRKKDNGFTLLELLVVSVLVVIMLSLSIPAFRTNVLTDQLRQAARRTIGTVTEVRHAALGSESGCFLEVDVGDNQISYTCPKSNGDAESEDDSARSGTMKMPEGIRITSVWSGDEDNTDSENAPIWINRQGLMDQLIINLTDGDRELALVSSVFENTIKLEDKAMSPEDLTRF